MQYRRQAAAFGVAIVATAAGCGRDPDDAIRTVPASETRDVTPNDVQLDVDEDAATVRIQDADTEIVAGENTALPDGFPREIPVYPGLKLDAAMASQANEAYSIQGATDDAPERVLKYYEDYAKEEEWGEESRVQVPDMTMVTYTFGNRRLNIMVTPSETGSTVQLTIGPK